MTAARRTGAPLLTLAAAAVLLAACSSCGSQPAVGPAAEDGRASGDDRSSETATGAPPSAQSAFEPPEGRAVAVFAGGCFWCVESAFEEIDGVDTVVSGYTGGPEANPTYQQVSSGQTGHYEAVRIVYDPSRVSYAVLLEVFWRNIDPTQDDGQFCDRGHQYLSAIFVADDDERRLAVESKDRIRRQLDEDVVTEILDAATFWVAEDYHQDFYRTNPVRYSSYRIGCGRDRRLRQLWGDTPAHP
jgi:peptide-methionine (S)-S-oxide reductase